MTPPLTLSGLLFFSTYSPFLESTPDPAEPKLTVCEKRGDSRSYSLFAFSGSGAGFDSQGNWVRYRDVDDVFVSEPFVEQFQTGNSGTASTTSPLPGNFDFARLMEELKTQLFSPALPFQPGLPLRHPHGAQRYRGRIPGLGAALHVAEQLAPGVRRGGAATSRAGSRRGDPHREWNRTRRGPGSRERAAAFRRGDPRGPPRRPGPPALPCRDGNNAASASRKGALWEVKVSRVERECRATSEASAATGHPVPAASRCSGLR